MPDSHKNELALRLVRQNLDDKNGNNSEEPEEPLPQECCGQSCKPCVFDIHRRDLHAWAKETSKTIKYGSSTIFAHVYGDDHDSTDIPKANVTLEKYTALKILEKVETSSDTLLYTISTGDNDLKIPIGGHLRARISINGHFISRQYTPTSVTSSQFQVPIKLYPSGKFTKHVKEWTVGSRVEWIGPFLPDHGDWLKNASSLLCIAAGTGIAPFIRLIDSLLDDGDCEMRIQLIYCVRKAEDVLFKDLLANWTKYWNFSVVFVISSELTPSGLPYLSKWHLGTRLKEELFLSLLSAFSPLGDNTAPLRVAVCGSKSFEKDVINFAKRGGRLADGQLFRFPG